MDGKEVNVYYDELDNGWNEGLTEQNEGEWYTMLRRVSKACD